MSQAPLYALDFDGVICDSAVETAMTGWKAAASIWQDMPAAVPAAKIQQFRLLRPIIETGYEAILVMRLLYLEDSIAAIYQDYADKTQTLLNAAALTVDGLKDLFGRTRDAWIAEDLADWVDMNPLFPGLAQKLQNLGERSDWVIITTKQERFVKAILQAHAIDLADARIFGLDRNMSKVAVLKQLLNTTHAPAVYFVEDRLPTLLNVAKEPALSHVQLIFALWGYNTADDKAQAVQQPFVLQQLDDFLLFT